MARASKLRAAPGPKVSGRNRKERAMQTTATRESHSTHRHDAVTCPGCQATVTPVRSSRLWWIPTIMAWGFIMTAGPLVAVMPPLNLVLIPVVFFMGASMLGYLGDKTSPEARCPACRKILVTDADTHAGTGTGTNANTNARESRDRGAAVLAGRSTGPSDERLVKRTLV
jgi:hypothetical protein